MWHDILAFNDYCRNVLYRVLDASLCCVDFIHLLVLDTLLIRKNVYRNCFNILVILNTFTINVDPFLNSIKVLRLSLHCRSYFQMESFAHFQNSRIVRIPSGQTTNNVDTLAQYLNTRIMVIGVLFVKRVKIILEVSMTKYSKLSVVAVILFFFFFN